MMLNKIINVALDCDEILTYICPIWMSKLCENYEFFSKYLNIDRNFSWKKDFGKILARKKFLLNEEYLKEGLTQDDLTSEFFEKFFYPLNYGKLYRDYGFPTQMAKVMAFLGETRYINKIHIVSRSPEENMKEKEEFLSKIFKNCLNKLEIHLISLHNGGTKADCINDIGNIDVFVDDELNNIFDVIHNCKREMDLFIPRLGYNLPTDNLIIEGSQNEKSIHYYDVMQNQTKKEHQIEYMLV